MIFRGMPLLLVFLIHELVIVSFFVTLRFVEISDAHLHVSATPKSGTPRWCLNTQRATPHERQSLVALSGEKSSGTPVRADKPESGGASAPIAKKVHGNHAWQMQ